MSNVTYTGELKASALAITLLHVQEWLDEKAPHPALPLEGEEVAEVVEIVRMYQEDVSYPHSHTEAEFCQNLEA